MALKLGGRVLFLRCCVSSPSGLLQQVALYIPGYFRMLTGVNATESHLCRQRRTVSGSIFAQYFLADAVATRRENMVAVVNFVVV